MVAVRTTLDGTKTTWERPAIPCFNKEMMGVVVLVAYHLQINVCHMCKWFDPLSRQTTMPAADQTRYSPRRPVNSVKALKHWKCSVPNWKCGPMPNVMAALPNIGGALCSTPQSLA